MLWDIVKVKTQRIQFGKGSASNKKKKKSSSSQNRDLCALYSLSVSGHPRRNSVRKSLTHPSKPYTVED